MEVRIEQRMTGRERRDRILQRWGSREELERAADRGEAEARSDRAMLGLLDEDPHRLEVEHEVVDVVELEPKDLAKLTPERLRLLAALEGNRDAGRNVTELAEHLGRDKKNVSEDLALLRGFGLVDVRREGRAKVHHLRGEEVAIRLRPRGMAFGGSESVEAHDASG